MSVFKDHIEELFKKAKVKNKEINFQSAEILFL